MGTDKPLIIKNLFDTHALTANCQWQPLTEGVYIAKIYEAENRGARSAFLRYLPGASVPNHEHLGFEHILILDGWQQDDETVYEAGTLVIHPPGTQHHLVAPEGCIALGIWEKPVSFTDR